MTTASILPNATGRIKKILVLNTTESDQTLDHALKIFEHLFGVFVQFGSPELQIILIGQNDFDTNAMAVAAVNYWDQLQQFMKTQSQAIRDRVKFVEPDFDMETFQEEWALSGLLIPGGKLDWNTFYDYIQDPILVMRDTIKNPIVLEPYYSWINGGKHDCHVGLGFGEALMSKFLPKILSSQVALTVKSTPWYFQGGNVIGDGEIVLVGEDIVKKNVNAYATTLLAGGAPIALFLQKLAETLEAQHIFCPGIPATVTDAAQIPCQPNALFHLDLWLTFGGLQPDGRMLLFVGQIHHLQNDIWVPKPTALDSRQGYLEDAVLRLQSLLVNGSPYFQIERLPLIEWEDKLLSYNNCLVEVEGNFRQVFMPVFARYLSIPANLAENGILKKADALAEATFRSHRFEVRPVDFGYRNLAIGANAGLHCKALVLQRS